jgi:hypothetical protein
MADHAPRFQAYCPRCEGIVRVLEPLSLDAFRRVVALRRGGHTMQAIAALIGTGSTDHADAKRLVFHITSTAGECHRCRKPLPTGAEVCPVCRCVNLDFTDTQPPESDVLTQSTGNA